MCESDRGENERWQNYGEKGEERKRENAKSRRADSEQKLT
jgi:hypothetical protein